IRNGNFKQDVKKGINQNDLYQMVTYAVRRGSTNILLLYPNIGEDVNTSDSFSIESGFTGADEIEIMASEVPFWSVRDFKALDTSLHECLGTILHKLTNVKR